MSTYENVRVLLVQWDADDLGVEPEVEKLAKVFKAPNPDGFNFSTERWSIPSPEGDEDEDESPEDLLNQRLMKFRRGAKENDLLILYYA